MDFFVEKVNRQKHEIYESIPRPKGGGCRFIKGKKDDTSQRWPPKPKL